MTVRVKLFLSLSMLTLFMMFLFFSPVTFKVWGEDVKSISFTVPITQDPITNPATEDPVHDVAVVDVVTVLPYGATEVYPDWKVNITVVVRNEGTVAETFNVTAYANSTTIDTKTVADLVPGENETLTFIWIAPDTAWWSGGWILSPANYTIRAEADVVDGETDTGDNVFIDGSVKVRAPGDVDGDDRVGYMDLFMFAASYKREYPYGDGWRCDFNGDGVIDARDLGWIYCIAHNTNIIPVVHDVGIIAASVAIPWDATEIYPGWLVNITVVVRNWGNRPETFTVTAYCDTTAIGTQAVTLSTGEKRTLTFIGNTTDVTPSATPYSIKVSASILPNEDDTWDNTLVDGAVWVKFQGDVDGDRKVSYLDLLALADAYNSRYGDPDYNPDCDFDGDGKVSYLDLLILADNYNKEY